MHRSPSDRRKAQVQRPKQAGQVQVSVGTQWWAECSVYKIEQYGAWTGTRLAKWEVLWAEFGFNSMNHRQPFDGLKEVGNDMIAFV